MKKILVTGGLGHIGSRLIRDLLKKGFFIACVDNLSTQRISSLRGLLENKNFLFIELDVAKNKAGLEQINALEDCDSLIHLAAITNAEASLQNPEIIFKNNLEATKNVVDICFNHNLNLIFPSSTSVYGSSEKEVYEDEPAFLNPQSPYAECKVQEENLILECNGLNASILRLGTIFGISPGMRFHTAVNKFCWQAVLNKPITVWKTAMNQYRPYLDLDDACKAFNFFLEDHKDLKGVYNILTANYTVKDILEVIRKYKEDTEIELVDSEIMNQLSYKVLNNKITKQGLQFRGNIDKGVKDTLDWLTNE